MTALTTTDRIKALEAAIAEQQRQLAEARAELDALKSHPPQPTVSRRDWLRRAALAGGALVAADAVVAGPAAALDGNPLSAGNQVNAEHTTTLFADYNPGSAYPNGLLHVTDTGFAQEAAAAAGSAAVIGYAGNANSGAAGVAGFGTTSGVYGECDQSEGVGLHGVALGTNGWGVYGNGAFHGLHGIGNTGVYGSGDTVGVYGFGPQFGVYGQTDVSSGVGVIGSGGGTGVLADGTTYGVHATANATGTPLRANITQSSNASSAIYGSTPGKGIAVKGVSTGGVGVLGTGVRGGSFGGTAAAFTARPSSASTHPSSGSSGDFFVDSSHRLWFCKGGTTWKQLA